MFEGVTWINKKLIEVYGQDLYGHANYRVVWTTSQTEKRAGTFEDYSGDIYLRTVTEVREVPKYMQFPDFWVLEAIQPNAANMEIKDNFSYEPLWVFGANGLGERQPVWRAVEFLVKSHKFVDRIKRSPSDIRDAEIAQFEKEKALFKTMIQDESPVLASIVHNGAGIFVPSNYERGK